VANIKLATTFDRSYGVFTKDSRLGIYGTGPHSGGSIISYSIWIQTSHTSEMILIHYGNIFGAGTLKNIYTLTLQNGTPLLYISLKGILKPEKKYDLNDGKWHHLAVSMPTESCTLSEVNMYVDGKPAKTISYDDQHIFFQPRGTLSIGGFGYSHESYESNFPHLSPFIGNIDQFYMWGKEIKGHDLQYNEK